MASLLDDIKKRLREGDKTAQPVVESKTEIDSAVMDKAFQEGEEAPKPKEMQADKDGDPATISADNEKIKKGQKGDIKPTGAKPAPVEVKEEDESENNEEVVAESDEVETEADAEEVIEAKTEITADDYKVVAEDINIEDDLNAIFGEEGDKLSEEFKSRVRSIFEAAVVAKINETTDMIAQSANEIISEQRDAIYEEVVDKVDQYVEKRVIPQWIEENQVALSSNVKLQVMESFMTGLKVLFEQHYVDIPEDKEDIFESVITENERLESALNEETVKVTSLIEEIETLKKNAIVSASSKGLSENQVEKLKTLAEAVEYQDDETFGAKVEELKEAYFPKTATKRTEQVETPVVLNEDTRKTGRAQEANATAQYIKKMFAK